MGIVNYCGFGNSYNFVKGEYNFDVDGNWDSRGILTQEDFNNELQVTTESFKIKGKNIKAKITSVTNNELNFFKWYLIQNINYITVENLTSINLGGNLIKEFNPIKKLPFGLESLSLFENNLEFFSPDLELPISLTSLNFEENSFRSAGYMASENWANKVQVNSNAHIYFTNNIDNVGGTNLQNILVNFKLWNVIS